MLGLIGWLVFINMFSGQKDFAAIANRYSGYANPGHASVFTLAAWLLTLYAGIAAYNADPSAPPPPATPAYRRLKNMDGI